MALCHLILIDDLQYLQFCFCISNLKLYVISQVYQVYQVSQVYIP